MKMGKMKEKGHFLVLYSRPCVNDVCVLNSPGSCPQQVQIPGGGQTRSQDAVNPE